MTTFEWIEGHVEFSGAECLGWPFGRDSYGYGRAKSKHHRTRLAHRIMCEICHGPPPDEKSQAIHTCGNGHLGCVNPSHLRWGTAQDNSDDKDSHGTKHIGEGVPTSKLKTVDITRIRQMHLDGGTQRGIAAEFGVSAGTIQAILEGRTWSHVK